MLNLLELAQFVSFAECGTLSKTAEQLHISQPTLTRTMRHVEDVFGVPLFHRGKNHLALNQTGEIAVKQARKLLENAENAVQTVQAFNRSYTPSGWKAVRLRRCGHCFRRCPAGSRRTPLRPSWCRWNKSCRTLRTVRATSGFCHLVRDQIGF